jgi:predicted RNA methylase
MLRAKATMTSCDNHRQTISACWEDHVVAVVFPALAAELRKRRRKGDVPGNATSAQQACDRALDLLFQMLLLFYADSRRMSLDDSLPRLRSELAAAGGDVRSDREERFKAAFGGAGRTLGNRLQTSLKAIEPFLFPSKERGARRLAPRLADPSLALLADDLSRVWIEEASVPQTVDYRCLSTRHLGSIYERLLDFPVKTGDRAANRSGKVVSRRKAAGCFYTPEPIVNHILETTVGPALDEKLAALREELVSTGESSCPSVPDGGISSDSEGDASAPGTALDERRFERLFEFRVLDPAMGTGHFLIAAAEYIASRIAAFLDQPAISSVSQPSQPEADCSARPREKLQSDLVCLVIERSLFGIDLDPRAIQLARAGLWLTSRSNDEAQTSANRRLRCGDALLTAEFQHFPQPGQFDAVIGNPPYGAKLEPAVRRALARALPLMRSNSDTAAGFIERAAQWAGKRGRVGLIVPKPLTYSYAWRNVRRFLRHRLERLVDVSRAWPEVRLEQAIIVFRASAGETAEYRSAWSEAGCIVPGARMSWALADRFGTLPCALSSRELRRLARLNFSQETVGDICRTFRGVAAQRWLDGAPDAQPVIGGRDLQRWAIRSSSGRLRREAQFSTTPFACEKLVFQNIIAHVTRPQPRIVLIGAYDGCQTVTLDTVNNLVAADRRANLSGLLALLHSELINWVVHAAVYNKAIRTMHFDQYFLDKIPLPEDWPELLERLASETAIVQAATAALNRLAARAASIVRPDKIGRWRLKAMLPLLLGKGADGASRMLVECSDNQIGEEWRSIQIQVQQLSIERHTALDRIDRLVSASYGDESADGGVAPSDETGSSPQNTKFNDARDH